ncbi:MAG: serine/threonine protein kinase [Proteobacteria bacterium]|nr:serine/threonine protein kinase [Pseudomonadota bacterium]
MKLSAADWARLLPLLDDALELPAPERAAWLQRQPAELQAPLAELLQDRQAIETHDFLAALPALDEPAASAGPAAGQRVGPYLLQAELGRGGMACVWLARRADGAHQRPVALKLPFVDGARSRLIAERFVRERRILSSLAHPHIAGVLDAGSDGGQPWLAMEYVQGEPLTQWADARRLDTAARLRLFLQVLQAVQHAHARLVIHRDIKPGNVLVDEQGQVKLLDFGVAKLLEADTGTESDTPTTDLTRWGGRALTPQYASPEQVAGRPLGTASDVYSLGVLLYELLTGTRPYTLARDTPAALEEAILGAAIRAPSQAAADAATRRALRGDLDTVLLKALALQPEQRYASAEALAQDLQRHLQRQPVLARPAGLAYRAGRLLRRHALMATASALVAVALLAGAGLALWQAGRARAEARGSQAAQAFLARLLSDNDPQQSQGRELSARELLQRAAGRIDTEFAGQPELQARLHQVVGGIFIELGDMAAAARHLGAALQARRQAALADDESGVELLFRLAQAKVELRDFEAAAAALAQTTAAADRLQPPPNRWTGRVLAYQAWLASQQGQLERSAALGRQALAAQAQVSGEASADYLTVASHIASNLIARGELPAAQALLAHIERVGPGLPDYPVTDLLGNRYSLATLAFNRGDFAEVERRMRELMPAFDRHLGPLHDRSVVARALLARVLAERGHYAEAVREQRANVDAVARRSQVEPEALALAKLQLVRLLTLDGRHDEAVALARELSAFFDQRYPQPTRYREQARALLADALFGAGRRDEGLRALRASIDHAAAMGRADNPLERAGKQLSLALASRRVDPRAAAALAAQACGTFGAALGAGNPRQQRCLAVQAWLQGLDPAAPVPAEALQRAQEVLSATWPPGHALRAELLAAEAEVLQAQHAAAPAAQRLQQAREAYLRATGRELPETLLTLH